MKRIEQIRAKKAALVERAAAERERIAAQFAPFRPPLALVDRSIAAGREVLAHPEWIIGALALILILRPRRSLAWAQRGFVAGRAWHWAVGAVREAATGEPA